MQRHIITPHASISGAPQQARARTPATTLLHSAARLLCLCACAAGAMSAHADDEMEREKLARIVGEIQRVQVMVTEASKTTPTPQRVRFRYDWLQRDLDLMRQGIEQHIEAPRQPRPVPPIRGGYRN